VTASTIRSATTQVVRRLLHTNPSAVAVDAACLVLRLALAWIFVYYGAAKLFAASGAGPAGLHQTALFMSQTAHLRPGMVFAVVAGLTEFGGGIAMALGLCTRLAGLALFADMVLAMITVTWATGFDTRTAPPGYQVNVILAATALAVALTGAGRYSIDGVMVRALDRSAWKSRQTGHGPANAPNGSSSAWRS